jgi:acetylornithine deacetylase/succinyl-diaminopimelate desuccinylase-like protein
MSEYQKIDSYLEKNLDTSLEELRKLVAQPSISAQGIGLKECANLVADMLRARGFTAEIMDTEGAPVVFAERKGQGDKTLLFYNHYDVQPPEPLELWDSPPFEPEIREGKMYGRGISDDKGHIVSRLHAIDSILAADGNLPCNIKFIIEGEEETASVHFMNSSDNKENESPMPSGNSAAWIIATSRCSILDYAASATWNSPSNRWALTFTPDSAAPSSRMRRGVWCGLYPR